MSKKPAKPPKGSQKSIPTPVEEPKEEPEEQQPQVQQIQTSGFGRFEYRNGIIYEGQWELINNQKMKHGEGVLQITVGNMSYEKGNEEYKGSWVEDKMEGYGTYRYTSGAKYTGEWKANKHHGKGMYEFPDGTLYEGEWDNHKMHGEGYYIDAKGQRWEGEFVEGVFQSKMQKELKMEKMLKQREVELLGISSQFFENFKEAFAKSDKKTFKENLLPFFSTNEEIKQYVKEPYTKYEEKAPDRWADTIDFCSQYNFSNVLRHAQNAKLIDPSIIIYPQFQGQGQVVEFKRQEEDRTVQLVLVNSQEDNYTIIYCHDTYEPDPKKK